MKLNGCAKSRFSNQLKEKALFIQAFAKNPDALSRRVLSMCHDDP